MYCLSHTHTHTPEAAAMIEFAVHQKPLHQVDVFLAGGAGAAEFAALDRRRIRFSVRLRRRLARLVQAAGDVVRGERGRREGKRGG